MAVVEVDKDQMIELFALKQNVKNTVLAVMDNRLTSAHLSADVFALLEILDQIEIAVIGEPLVQEVPQEVAPQAPAQEEQAPQPEPQQESAPVEQPEQAQPEQPQPEQQQNQS
jgi:outer membrane biosynthesis protein TonB